MSKRMCQSIFVSAIESALFPVGCLCVYSCVCVCARHRTDLSPGGWLSCFQVSQLPMAKIKVTLCVYFFKNITTGKVVNGIIFWTLGFF